MRSHLIQRSSVLIFPIGSSSPPGIECHGCPCVNTGLTEGGMELAERMFSSQRAKGRVRGGNAGRRVSRVPFVDSCRPLRGVWDLPTWPSRQLLWFHWKWHMRWNPSALLGLSRPLSTVHSPLWPGPAVRSFISVVQTLPLPHPTPSLNWMPWILDTSNGFYRCSAGIPLFPCPVWLWGQVWQLPCKRPRKVSSIAVALRHLPCPHQLDRAL